MLTDAELASMRATSATAMPDTGTITAPATTGTLDETTGVWTPGAPTTVYSGKMRVRRPTAEEHTVLFGDQQVTKARYVATLPHDANTVEVGHELVLSESSDAQLVGVPMRVLSVSMGSWEIDRRVAVEVVADG